MYTLIERLRKSGSRARGRGGYIIVEAAIFMPIMIIGLCSLCFMIKYGILCERAYHIATEETKVVMREMYASGLPVLEGPKRLEEELEEELTRVSEADVTTILPYFAFPKTDCVKQWSVALDIGLPANIDVGTGESAPASFTLYFRPFIGKDNTSAAFENPEEDEAYEEVWVFPKSGERYHTEDCRIVKSYPQQRVLTQGVKLKYGPCKLCNAKSLPNGSVVYCFKSEGSKYHRASCSAVEKYVISMDRSDAEAKGYTPCKICGGYRGN